MTWQASLPLVSTMAEMPCLVTERKTCSLLAALIASTQSKSNRQYRS